jgi:rfaE bifunctional protein kinase chain/domain
MLQDLPADRLQQWIDRFRQLRIAVVGDFFLDKYLEVDPALAEISVETGKTANQVVRARSSPGAAGTVVCNLAALGTGTLHAIGFTGDDGESYELRQGLTRLGCRTELLHYGSDRMTPTYLKPRNISDPSLAGEHERYDTKNRCPTPAELQRAVIVSIGTLLPKIDALIIMDQAEEEDCGVVTTRVREMIAEQAPKWPKVVFWADSRRRIRRFRNVIIKPNQFETVGHENPLPDETVDFTQLEAALGPLRREIGAPIVATRGAAGMVVSDPELTVVPGVRVEGPTDPTGAGDSATSGAVLALAAGASLPEAALVGNLVASITVQQLATTGTAKPEELPPRLEMWRRQRG